MFDNAMRDVRDGSVTPISKVALIKGSSQHGKNLRADVGHKYVTAKLPSCLWESNIYNLNIIFIYSLFHHHHLFIPYKV